MEWKMAQYHFENRGFSQKFWCFVLHLSRNSAHHENWKRLRLSSWANHTNWCCLLIQSCRRNIFVAKMAEEKKIVQISFTYCAIFHSIRWPNWGQLLHQWTILILCTENQGSVWWWETVYSSRLKKYFLGDGNILPPAQKQEILDFFLISWIGFSRSATTSNIWSQWSQRLPLLQNKKIPIFNFYQSPFFSVKKKSVTSLFRIVTTVFWPGHNSFTRRKNNGSLHTRKKVPIWSSPDPLTCLLKKENSMEEKTMFDGEPC